MELFHVSSGSSSALFPLQLGAAGLLALVFVSLPEPAPTETCPALLPLLLGLQPGSWEAAHGLIVWVCRIAQRCHKTLVYAGSTEIQSRAIFTPSLLPFSRAECLNKLVFYHLLDYAVFAMVACMCA